MGQTVTLTGMVLSAIPIGDYDKRIVVLTKERGKITAFAKGARRQNSTLLAATNPFAFGTFTCYEGRTSYNMVQADISNYFRELSQEFEAGYYGFYFLEFTDYCTRENSDEVQMLRLLYASLRGLLNKNLSHELVRYVFELKAMVLNGEYPEMFCCVDCGNQEHLAIFAPEKDGMLCSECKGEVRQGIALRESSIYTFQYIISSSIEKLYTFTVSPEVLSEMRKIQKLFCKTYIGKQFKSLEILETIIT